MNEKTRLLSSLFVAHALVHGAVLSIPLFIPIWASQFSVTRTQLGFAAAVMLVFYGGMAIPAGVLSDQFGSDRFITLFLLVTGIGFSLMLLVESFVILGLCLAAIGIGAGLYHAPALSLISRQSYTTTRIFAYHNIGGNLGIALGPLIVIVFLAFFDWRFVLALIAIPFIIFGAIFHLAGPTDTANRHRHSPLSTDVFAQFRSLLVLGFLFVLTIYMLRGAYFRGTITFLPDFLEVTSTLAPLTVFGEDIPPGRWIYSAILLLGVIGEYIGGEVGERIDTEYGIVGVFFVLAVITPFLGMTNGWTLFAIAGMFGLVVFVFPPLIHALVAEYSPETSRGIGYGVTSAGNIAFGGFAGTALAGWLVTVFDYSFMFAAFAVFPIVGIAIIIAFKTYLGE